MRDGREECVSETAGQHRADRPRSTVLLTASPPLLGVCHRVVFLAADEVVEGTHAELLARPDYAAVVLR